MTSGAMPNVANVGVLLPKPRPSVICQSLPDGAILYCAEQELYFGLNRTGACVWENLSPACTTLEEVCAVITQRFANVDAGGVRDDAKQLLARLSEHALVVPS